MRNVVIERMLSDMVSEERVRHNYGLPSMGTPTMAFQKVAKNLALCKPDELALIKALLIKASKQACPSQQDTQTHNASVRQKHISPALTVQGTERQRAWGLLQPAVEAAIRNMEEISSIAVYKKLKEEEFPFATDRAISSIAKVLRILAERGVLIRVTKGHGRIPVTFKHRERRESTGMKGTKLLATSA